MAFTVRDYHDLVRLLREHPEWREELRSLLLTEDFVTLPQVMKELAAEVRALAEAQRRTEERVEALAEAQRKTEERLNALAERVESLARQVEALAEAQRRTEESLRALAMEVRELAADHRRLRDTVAHMRGQLLEMVYKERAPAYFGKVMRRVRVARASDLEEALEASLSPEEFYDVLLLDLLVHGKVRGLPGEPEAWLAVEVSAVVDQHDVERAARRARLLGKAGFKAIPVAAGEEVEPKAVELARIEKVAIVRDGEVSLWEEALEEWGKALKGR